MKTLSILGTAALMLGVATPVMNAQDSEPDYLRSSLYTVIIKSDDQNDRLDKENKEADGNELLSLAKSLKKGGNQVEDNLAEIPAQVFVNIAIPPQFNDHNLANLRVIDFDPIAAKISKEQAEAANEAFGLKKKKGGGFLKGLAAVTANTATGTEIIEEGGGVDVTQYSPAVLQEFIKENNIPALIIAQWFDYAPDSVNHWNTTTLDDRALGSLSISEQSGDNSSMMTAAGAKALNLIPNTFMLATNLKFQSNKAILKKMQAAADAANALGGGGMLGSLASKAAGMAAGAAMGDGFRVTADSYLFKINWNEGVEEEISKLMETNGTLQDLIDSGVCTIEFVGKGTDHASVRQSIMSDKPISSLVERATTRAIDKSIAKLQEKNEVFRSIFPISSFEPDGTFKVKIGEREGVSKGDEYAILEKVEDANGKISYKQIGSAKPNDKMIWNNQFGAEEEALEGTSDDKKDKEFNAGTINLGATTFVGKKGKDYTGCYVQLKKKK